MRSTNATRPAVLILISIDPAMHFILRLDLTDHRHPENLPAEHAKVREWLNLASQAIGSNSHRSGELIIPVYDPSSNVGRRAVIGSWEFTDTAPAARMEA
jgi:hypothetical protein